MRTVLVTGTSSGIGLVTTIELAKRGWHVTATMRNLNSRAELDRRAQAAGVSDLITVEAFDIADAAAIDSLVGALDLENRPLTAVIHNAGVAAGGAFEDLDSATIRHVFEVNFFGVLELTKRLLPSFRAARSGRILIVSSEAAFAGQAAISPYCASKWAIEGWAESVAYEVEPFGIDVILVEPGAFRTNIWDATPRTVPDSSPYRPLLEHVETLIKEHVARTAGDPQDVAEVIATALEAKDPKVRYVVGRKARFAFFLRGKIPVRWQRKLVRHFFKFDEIRW